MIIIIIIIIIIIVSIKENIFSWISKVHNNVPLEFLLKVFGAAENNYKNVGSLAKLTTKED